MTDKTDEIADLRSFKKDLEKCMTEFNRVKWITRGVILLLLVWAGSSIWTLSALNQMQRDHQEAERRHRKELQDLERDLRNDFQRPPITAYTSSVPELKIGEIAKVDGDKITIADKDKNEYTYILEPSAAVHIKGKSANLEDLKPGMHVHFTISYYDGSKIRVIDNVDNAPPLEPPD